MVNSGSFDSDGQGDRNAKVSLTQPHNAPDSTQSSSPVTASVATSCNAGFSQTADSGLPSVAHAIEPTPNKTEFNCDMLVGNFTNLSSVGGDTEESAKSRAVVDEKNSLCCSLPLEKIQGVLTSYHAPLPKADDDAGKATAKQPARKLLCLYCDRSFVNVNLRQKHVERIHSVKQNRRVSSRRQNQLTVTPCVYCDKLNGTENTLKDLFQHLVNEHSSKYFGCLPCEDRFLTSSLLADHNAIIHQFNASQDTDNLNVSTGSEKTTLKSRLLDDTEVGSEKPEEIPVKITRSKMKLKPEEDSDTTKSVISNKKKSTKLKELRSKKYSVKSSRIALKRRESKRLQAIAKLTDTQKKKRTRPVEKKHSNTGKMEQNNSTKSTEKIKTSTVCINPYPEFDHFYRVKKITDHSIDNLKISSLTFDDVFDKAFFNRIRCNIEENLLHHIDGKLFKNEESESRISNFEKISNVPQEIQNANSENYGCELSLNAVTPVASLSLNSQFGEDFESQIEYGSKPSKKKTQPRKDEIHYKYFTRRKYQASILEHKENRDLSKLDMWTQLVIKKRQQKMLDDKKSAKEILEYTSCDEYKNKLKREELNRILDRRGPFEDLKEEASKKAALDKLNSASDNNINEETFTEVREVLNEILNRVFETTDDMSVQVEIEAEKATWSNRKEDFREIPGYLNLRRSSSLPSDGEIDKSDKIALICSSQETENFELPTNQVRGKNELIELTGEWARCRMYICAACGAKLPNMRYLLDHKSLYHQNVWVQHYEFVGNQSELYRHLSIPALGKVGAVEDSVQCKVWKRSDARLCTKCGKQCNSLGELHRHILECGGDWTWMLARKKCKYRPFGAKSRRKRRGLIHRVHNKQKTEPTEKKTYKKTFDGPRQRPSDADTIQRMLANLPAKRSTRKLISLHDGIYRARKSTQNIKQNKVKCGKMIYKSSSRKETTEKTVNATPSISKTQINSSSNRRSLRNFNKVLASRILDTNTNLNVKRKIKALNERRKTRQSLFEQEIANKIVNEENFKGSSADLIKPKSKVSKKEDLEDEDTETPNKKSPKSSPKDLKKKMSVKKLLTGKINIKSFFPVKKKKSRKILSENQNPQDTGNTEVEKNDIKTRSKRKCAEPCDAEEEKKREIPVKTIQKKSKHETFSTLVRSLSLRRNKLIKKSGQGKTTEIKINNINAKKENRMTVKSEERKPETLQNNEALDKMSKKRKLKNSFRNVINKVKKLKINSVSENCDKLEEPKLELQNPKEGAFLEESNQEGLSATVRVEKVVIPSILEAKENTADMPTTAPIAVNFHDANENPPIPETIFKLELNNEKSLQAKGELDFDTQPITTNANKNNDVIEENANIQTSHEDTATNQTDKTQPISIITSMKPKIVPLISPNMKGKIRKPARGLNDCIAMLTNKLQQKTVEENSVKVNNVLDSPSPVTGKIECILRIPNYRSQLTYSEIEETALDLSTKSLRNKEPTEKESLEKPLSMFDQNTVMKHNSAQFNNFIIPTSEQKLNKAFNSVDHIIEEVVENRTKRIVPEIQQRKWNSVDDIIQKVIDEQHFTSEIKLPIRNSVDDIIDFVVQCGKNTDIINDKGKVNEIEININQNIFQNKEATVRKIGSIRKSRSKKGSIEIAKPEVNAAEVSKIEVSVPKESQENISPLIKTNVQSSDAVITKSESSKKKVKSKRIVNNVPQMESKIVITETCMVSPNESDVVPEIVDTVRDKCEKDVSIGSKEVDFTNRETSAGPKNSPQKVDLGLNDAFVNVSCDALALEKSSTIKNKKVIRRIGQNRNRSRCKKLVAKNTEPKKMFIETNIDALLDVKEMRNEILKCSTHISVSSENLMTKNDEIKQLSNEDEPHLLENKPMTHHQKSNIVPSDSEDDIPLAALVKSDENRMDSPELKTKDVHLQAESSNNGHAIERQNNVNGTIKKLIENEIIDKTILLEVVTTVGKSDEKLDCEKNKPSEVDQKQEENADHKNSNIIVNISTEPYVANTNLQNIVKLEVKHNINDTSIDNKFKCDITSMKISDNLTDETGILLNTQSTANTRTVEFKEIANQHTETMNSNEQSKVTSYVENSKLSKIKDKHQSLLINEDHRLALDFVSVEVKRNTRRKSKSLTRKTKNISNSINVLIEENLILLEAGLQNAINLDATCKRKTKLPNKETVDKFNKSHSKLIGSTEYTNENKKLFAEEFHTEKKTTIQKPEIKPSSNELDLNTESTLINIEFNDATPEVSKELQTSELKLVLLEPESDESFTKSEVKITKPKGKSEVSRVILTSDISQSQINDEKPFLKTRRKSKSVKAKICFGSEFSNGSTLNTAGIEDCQEQVAELISANPKSNKFSKPEMLKSKNKSKGLKSKAHGKSKISTDSIANNTCIENHIEYPNKIKSILTGPDTKASNKKLNQKINKGLLIEEDIPLKIIQQNVCDGISVSDEYEDTDKEIESILCSSQKTKTPNIEVTPSKNKNVKYDTKTNILDMVSNTNHHTTAYGGDIEKSKKKRSPHKNKAKSPKSKDIFDNVNSVLKTIKDSMKEIGEGAITEANDAVTKSSPEVASHIEEEALKEEAPLTKKPKESKLPQMKNLEIALQLTDVTKLDFPLFNNKNDVQKKQTGIVYESQKDFGKPEIKVKRKRQSKFTDKQPENANYVDYDNSFTRSGNSEPEEKTIVEHNKQQIDKLNKTNLETIVQIDKPTRSRSRSVKNKIISNTTGSEDADAAENLSTKKLIEELIESKKEILRSKSKITICTGEKKRSENVNSTLGKIQISSENTESKIQLDDSCNDYISTTTEHTFKQSNSLNVKPKVKHKKHSKKISKKTKNKLDRTSQSDNVKTDVHQLERHEINDTERSPTVATINVSIVETSITSTENANSKTDDSLSQTLACDKNTNENKVTVEPPIKIVINKQKTRRKSKSFKKIDLKGQNDLFEDFALVIKKPKRVASIIAFTPTDTFSNDIYPNYFKKPTKESIFISEVNSETEQPEITAELDSSVEEMDMELDEIPITSNIIEREAKSFLPVVCPKIDKEIFVESLNVLTGETKSTKEENNTRIARNDFSTQEELFLSSEKDLTLPTEEDVEEFLYESNEIQNINSVDKQDIDSPEKTYKVDFGNKDLDDSFEIVQELTKLVSKDETGQINNSIVEVLTTSNEENHDKSVEKIIDCLLKDCETFSEQKEEKISKSINKKTKKSKNNKNNKIKIGNVGECRDINIELEQVLQCREINYNKRKRSKSIAEISSVERSQNVSSNINKELKFKDIDSIYAFSESEDFEIEKPIEKPKRSARKQTKSLSESVDILNDSLIELDLLPTSLCYTDAVTQSQNNLKLDEEKRNCKEMSSKSEALKRRSRSSNCSEGKLTREIKENDVTDSQEERKKSIRSAKVKALEHIHDDALAELTESERNRDLNKNKSSISKENSTPIDEINKKRVSKRQSRSQKTQRLFDELKLPSEAALTGDNVNDQEVEDCFQETSQLNENMEDPVKKSNHTIIIDDKDLLQCHEIEYNQNEIDLLQANKQISLIQGTKKRNCKKNKLQKNKNSILTSISTLQLTAGNNEKPLLLTDISGDLTGFEELENSIEKELNAEIENSDTQLKHNKKQAELCKIQIQKPLVEDTEKNDLLAEDTNLRRSRRGSRKIASYNENDLIDPIIDEIDGKKKIRKKEKLLLEGFENENKRKLKEMEKKLNSEELFDLLKASSVESSNIQKPQNTLLLNSTNDSIKNFKAKDFQSAFDGILEPSSPCLNLRNYMDKCKETKNVDSIYEFPDSPEDTNQLKDTILSLDVTRKHSKKASRSIQSFKSQEEENSDSLSVNGVVVESRTFNPCTPDILELSTESRSKSMKSAKADTIEKSNYCEICNKKFIRTDNLLKHKRTLTHIQKLSEIEAKEAAQKLQPHQSVDDLSNSVIEVSNSTKPTQSDINIHDILQESDKPNQQESTTEHTSFPNNHSLKLADIINDVLNKPVIGSDNEKHNSFSDIVMQNNGDIQPEYRRYKSLGERKSFDAEILESQPIPISESYVSKTILEKQISLLEDIIENQAGVNYIDDISMSSNNSLENNVLVSPSELSLKQDDSNTYSRINSTKPNTSDESFLKPSQYEEISEDSVNLRSYEDQKLRKTLNRDEELFLECCSLLKSGSEMSSYSNKKSHNRVLGTMGLKQCDEPEWLERKSLVEKPLYDVANEYSDNSRIPTPLGDSYDDDASDSNTISSNWNMNKKVNVFEDISQDKEEDLNKSFSFQEILNEEDDREKSKSNLSKFGEILSKTVVALPKILKRINVPDNAIEEHHERKQEELSDGSISESKKMITKGARKVFEGLKVSIPTEELNLEEVLNCSPKSKKIDIANIQNFTENVKCASLSSAKPPRTARKSKPVKNKSQFGSNLLFKMKKKKVMSPTGTINKSDDVKTHDIYDFEETQDNTDVFTKPDFRTFRNMKSNETTGERGSDTDSRDYVDSFSYEAPSITSSISSTSSKKPKTQENITKKKCMIMGRIFKNAAKSKIEDIDEEIRDIPPLDNCELVESYVADCKKIIKNEEVAKPKLTEKEINQLFDQLLEDRLGSQDLKSSESKNCTKPKTDIKKADNKKKVKQKNKKRTRTNSDSTDDEFNLSKINKKRAYRKNAKAEDNCINLEQELKECIGVASRKSQRKCTSGKQNVLVEYWSSDDSQFEALLESQRIEVKQPSKVPEETKNVATESEPVLEVLTENVSVDVAKPIGLDSLEKLKPKNTENKPPKHPQKRKSCSEKKLVPTMFDIEKTSDSTITSNRRKRAAVNPLYHWSSSSEDESQDLIEVKPIRDEIEDDEDRPVQHGWIVGDSPKKLVTMLAQAKGKKADIDCVKEQGKKRTNAVS